MRKLDVADQVLVQGRIAEREDRIGDIVTRSLDGNVVVLLKVDAGVLLGRVVSRAEKIALQAGVGRASNVLAVTPLAIARAASIAAAAAAAAALATTAVTAALAALAI